MRCDDALSDHDRFDSIVGACNTVGPVGAAPHQIDVVIYGGTAGGVIMAVAAAREGAPVALVASGSHLGGMTSGGLGWTDYGPDRGAVIGGYSLEFYERVSRHYGRDVVRRFNERINRPHLGDTGWYFEPRVAERILGEMAKEAGVRVFYNHRLRERGGVRKKGTEITEIVTENGASFAARIFADGTYEGDLMAQANVSYTWGRESQAQYGQSLAGSASRTPKISSRAAFRLRPNENCCRVLAVRGEVAGDKKLQAYTSRGMRTRGESRAVSATANYDPSRY